MNRLPKPFFLELAGLPGAGKTTTASLLFDELMKRGIRCAVVAEAAARSPISHVKRSWQFNAWTLCQTVASILEHQARASYDVVVVDRGLVDALSWVAWFRSRGEIEGATADVLDSFAKVGTWFQAPQLILVLRVKLETALQRRGQNGRILNPQTFQELRDAYSLVCDRLKTDHVVKSIHSLDTDELSPLEVLDWTLARMGELVLPPLGAPRSVRKRPQTLTLDCDWRVEAPGGPGQ